MQGDALMPYYIIAFEYMQQLCQPEERYTSHFFQCSAESIAGINYIIDFSIKGTQLNY